MEEGREAGKSLMKREKSTEPRTDPCMGLATLSGPVAVEEERFVAATRNLAGKKGKTERRMRLRRACVSAELGQVPSGSHTQGLWLKNRIVGSQVVGEDRSRLPIRGTFGGVRKRGR